MSQYKVSYVIKQIQKYAGDREVVLFGENEELLKSLKNSGIKVEKTFTRVITSISNEKKIYDAALLKEKASSIFVCCLSRVSNSEKFLGECGFKKHIDYAVFEPERVVIQNINGPYEDDYGNSVTGNIKNVSLIIQGFNNKIHMENIVANKQLSIQCIGDDNVLICNKSRWVNECSISINGVINYISLGNCRMNNVKMRCYGATKIEIGDDCTFEEKTEILASSYSSIKIGVDCMMAREVLIHAGDGHTIYEISTGKVTNQNRNSNNDIWSEIEISDHVWIGRRTLVLSGGGKTEIGKGSIAGAMSVVKGKYPNNVIIAGISAKVIKKDMAWSRNSLSTDISDCNGYTDYTYFETE